MKWEDFVITASDQVNTERLQLTDIDCPVCGKKIYRRMDIVLTSYPEQYQYECCCGWTGTAFK